MAKVVYRGNTNGVASDVSLPCPGKFFNGTIFCEAGYSKLLFLSFLIRFQSRFT